eukprot:TRINITY_DN71983_c0_g1_i1.p1 TRINITY_DN71983_c0_g1~~TRINITY_DN71983_c0_g1_i1.p1  ORF type:complete len:532 (-),score=71.44 TRINITY_DN71983_c0_g1_i1:290-1846(-)
MAPWRYQLALIVFVVAASFGGEAADKRARAVGGSPAVLQLQRRGDGSGEPQFFPALLAEWSEPSSEVVGSPLIQPADAHGCSRQERCLGCAIFVLQGKCTFAAKAKRAEAAGASLLVVASASEGPLAVMAAGTRPPNITESMVSKNSGRQSVLAIARGDVLKASCFKESVGSYADVSSEFLVGFFAVGLVVAGAWHSVQDLREPSQRDRWHDEVVAVEESSGPHFVLMGSIMLTVLFFFMKYLIYCLLLLFAFGAVSTTSLLLEPILAARCPALRERRACTLPKWFAGIVGVSEERTASEAAAEGVGLALAVAFLVYRNNVTFGWLLQDTIGAMLLLTIQRSLRLPNLKVASMLLACTFFFDIFWVFISPYIFKKSVMIEVATGGGTGQSVPMVLKIPAFNDSMPGQFKILGLGDVALPGLLISMLLRHDLLQHTSCCKGYFVASVIGYAVGLVATFISLYLMKHGQPALLFLVPGTLLPTFAIALCKGELQALWDADYGPATPEGYRSLADGADKQA